MDLKPSPRMVKALAQAPVMPASLALLLDSQVMVSCTIDVESPYVVASSLVLSFTVSPWRSTSCSVDCPTASSPRCR